MRPNSGFLKNLPKSRYFWFFMVNGAIVNLASTMLGPFIPVFLNKQLGISVGEVSFLYFVSGTVGTLSVFFVGWLVDRIGRRKMYVFGSSNAVILPAALSQVRSFSQALPVIALVGVMDSSSRSSQSTIIADQVEEGGRNTAYGISRIVGNAAWIVAPLVGGAMLAGRGFGLLFLVSTSLGVAALLVFIGLVPESRKAGLEKPSLPRISVLRNRELLVLCVASLFSMLFYSQFYSLLPIFATQVRGLSEVEVGGLFSISGVTVVLLQLPTSRWLNRFRKQTGYILGVVIMAAGITSLGVAPSFQWLLLSVFLMTVGENMFFPIALALVFEIAPEAERGMYVGAFSLFLGLGGDLSPLLGGTIWQITNNPYLPWLLSPLYAAISVGLAAYYRIRRTESHEA